MWKNLGKLANFLKINFGDIFTTNRFNMKINI